ncbi:MAG: acyltransferase domain-containing protein [Burkholderia sp.]
MSSVHQQAAAPWAARPTGSGTVFMFGGQGTQYFQMGRELYRSHPVFRARMDACDALIRAELAYSLTEVLYQGGRKASTPFDDILQTHPALFSIGYSLGETLRAEGIEPAAVLGYSLGEYIALACAGCLHWEDGLHLVMRQAQVLARHAAPGGMLSVFAAVEQFGQRPELYGGSQLAVVNFSGSFCVSGARETLEAIHRCLEAEGVIATSLPIRFAFHSSGIDLVEERIRGLAANLRIEPGRVPVYSCRLQRAIGAADIADPAAYCWGVVRDRVPFEATVRRLAADLPAPFLVDLSATGTLATFMKYARIDDVKYAHCINQFGRDLNDYQSLMSRLESA